MEMLATIEQTSSKCPEEALSIMMPRSSKALSTIGFFPHFVKWPRKLHLMIGPGGATINLLDCKGTLTRAILNCVYTVYLTAKTHPTEE
jgi:hypothetical protein